MRATALKWFSQMFGFPKKTTPVEAPAAASGGVEKLVEFIENSCKQHLGEVLNFNHPDWEPAVRAGDFRTLVTMYSAAHTAYEQHADHMFSEWMKGGKLLGLDVEKTTIFYYMVNRRFSHVAQIRCYLDYQLKLTLVPPDERERLLSTLVKILSPEMSDSFFPTPAFPNIAKAWG